MAQIGRIRQEFPTRQYKHTESRSALTAPVPLQTGQTYRLILGRDNRPVAISAQQGLAQLGDPMAQLVLFSGAALPMSLRALLTRLDQFNADSAKGLPQQNSFVVADGGQIPWTPETNDLARSFRFAITRRKTGSPSPDLLISCSTDIDSDSAFLQVASWDPVNGAFEFYDRRDGSWFWAGSSWDALAPDTRGQGPFDSHINGALNMKELKQPWVNWHSQSAVIRDSVLAPNDPLRAEPLWTGRNGAEDFERQVARPGIRQWNDSRFARCVQNDNLTRLPEFMRQVLETTTVNLASSPTSNAALATAGTVSLPLTFFLNSEVLLDLIDLEPDIQVPQVSAAIYRIMLQRYAVALSDGNHQFQGDTNFVFVVPEPAFEDIVVIDRLLQLKVLSPKLAASLLMIDFYNPVFSTRRAALTRHVPASASVQNPATFADQFISNIRQAATAGSPEEEFLQNWNLDDNTWKPMFVQRIEGFFQAIAPRFTDADGFATIFELAESRRREFRKRPLAEFRLTTPITNIPPDAPLLQFSEDGSIHPK